MTTTEITARLRSYNLWRRGNLDGMPQPDPHEIGEAISIYFGAETIADAIREAKS